MNIARLAAGLLCVSGIVNSSQAVVIDQFNIVEPAGTINTAIDGPYGQEFTPSLTGLDFVDLRVVDFGSDAGPGADFRVLIRDDTIDGTILGTSDTIFVPDGTNLGSSSGIGIITRFPFASVVPLTPGDRYVIEVDQRTLVPGTFNFGVSVTSESAFGTYNGGRAILSGNPVSTRDLLFAEGLTVIPEPSAWNLLSGIFLTGVGFRRRKPARRA